MKCSNELQCNDELQCLGVIVRVLVAVVIWFGSVAQSSLIIVDVFGPTRHVQSLS
jgi:hypothetical protein